MTGRPGGESAQQAALRMRWETTVFDGPIPADLDSTLTFRRILGLPGQEVSETVAATLPAPATHVPGPDDSVGFGYRVGPEVGRGGMGVVLRAEQASLRREVAVKRLPENAKQPDSTLIPRFVAEAQTTAFLDHPNVVPVHDLVSGADGRPSLTMKLVRGVSWSDALAKRSFEENLEVLISMCNALAFAHSKGIIHRDLKPSNVMVGGFGEVLVMDWGLALDVIDPPRAGAHAPHRTTVAGPEGTPAYMAPEQADGEGRTLGAWTDVYQLGAILYELLSGRPPHACGNLWQAIISACSGKVPPFPEDAPADLVDLATRALAAHPGERPDVAAFQAGLKAHLRHRQSVELSDSCSERLARCSGDGRGSAAYAELAEITAGFQQALVLWEDNADARSGVRRARLAQADAALGSGDLGLAAAQLSELDADDPEVADRRVRVERARAVVASATRRTRLLKGGLALATLSLVVTLSVSYLQVSAEQARTAKALEAESKAHRAESVALQAATTARDEEAAQRRAALAAKAEEVKARRSAEVARSKEAAQRARAEAAHAGTLRLRAAERLAQGDVDVGLVLHAEAQTLAPSLASVAAVELARQSHPHLVLRTEVRDSNTLARSGDGRLRLLRGPHQHRFSPQGRWRVVTAGDGVHLIPANRPKTVPSSATLLAGSRPGTQVILVRFSLGEERVYAPTADNGVGVWRTADRTRLRTAVPPDPNRGLLLGLRPSSDERIVFFVARRTLYEIRQEPGARPRRIADGPRGPTNISWVPGGAHLIVDGFSVPYVLERATGRVTARLEEAPQDTGIWDVAPDGKRWATVEGDVVKLRRLPDCRVEATLPAGAPPKSVRFSADGRRLAILTLSGLLSVWALEPTSPPLALPAGQVAWVPGGRRLLVQTRAGCVLVDPASGKRTTLQNPPRHLSDVARLPDGRLLLRGARGSRTFDPEGGTYARLAPGAWTRVPGSARALHQAQNRLRLVDLSTHTELAARGLRSSGPVTVAPDGRHAVAVSAGQARVLALPSLKEIAQFAPPKKATGLFFSTPEVIVDVLGEKARFAWSLRLRAPLKIRVPPPGYGFPSSPDHRRAVVPRVRHSFLWDADVGARRGQNLPFGALSGADVAFSPDGRHIVRYGRGVIQVFDPDSGKARAPQITAPEGTATITFVGDRVAAVGHKDGRVVLLDLESGRPLGSPLRTPAPAGTMTVQVHGDPQSGRLVAVAKGWLDPPIRASAWDLSRLRSDTPREELIATLAAVRGVGRGGTGTPVFLDPARWAKALQARGRTVPAVEATLASPPSVPALRRVSDQLFELEADAEANVVLTQLIGLNPNDARAFIDRVGARRRIGLLEPALADANRAVALAPRSPFARAARGQALAALGRHKEALPDYEPIMAGRYARILARFRAKSREALGNLKGAAADYALALTFRPKSEVAYALARVRARLGDSARAIKALERASELGWKDVDQAKAEPAFAPLAGLPAYQALLKRLSARRR